LPKCRAFAENVDGVTPIPDRENVSGLLAALVATVIDVAGTGPAAVGEKVTNILQFENAASVVPQVVLEIA
jgi:hypothetical protein